MSTQPIHPTNSLAKAASSYLRSAMYQPIQWYEWTPEAFAEADLQEKPILLDIGAVWCHWCHVMDRESYESDEIAQILNERFIAIKVDRDERPDVDARYQAAVTALTGQGGWPLTVFMTPQAKIFFGGTYFPPQDTQGRASFKRVLLAISDAFRERRAELEQESETLMQQLPISEAMPGTAGEFSPTIVEQVVESALEIYDSEFGGFGTAPKFPHPATMDLLLDWYVRTGNKLVGEVTINTLANMARGGVYDQLAGGFHRYSVDERWCVPHFEKMAYDNSELLKNYVHGFQATQNPFFAEVARDIMRWMREWLSDRERGGYYGSQDADIDLNDDGGYFTWTLAEACSVLNEDELAVAVAHYDISEFGEMPHDHSKNVLWVRDPVEKIAEKQNRPVEQVKEVLASAKQKLYAARLKRPTPFVDRTLYTGWNAMCISATLIAARILGDHAEQKFALRSLDRLLAEAYQPETGLNHVIAYAGDGGRVGPAGVLDDYAFTILACLDGFESTSDLRYFHLAEELAARMIAGFHDPDGGGFFDLDNASSEAAIGVLSTRRKPFRDSPTPAGNSMAAIGLMRLYSLNGEERLRDIAKGTLEAFAGIAAKYGISAGTYAIAAAWLARSYHKIVVVGDGNVADEFLREALIPFALNKHVLRVRDGRQIQDALPPAVARNICGVPGVDSGRPVALLCSGYTCRGPFNSPEELRTALQEALGPQR